MSDVFGPGHPILTFLNGLARHSGWLHSPAITYAVWLGPLLLGVLLLAGWWLARSRSITTVAAAVWAGAGSLLAIAVNQPLAHLVGEPRPYFHAKHVDLLVPVAHDFSFPSDHAVLAGAVITGLWFVDRRLTAIAAVLGLLLCGDRVYVGAHYGHDVIAGLLVGGIVAALGRFTLLPVLKRIGEHLARTPLRALLISHTARPNSARS